MTSPSKLDIHQLLTPAVLSSYRPKADGSMNLTFATQVLNKEQVIEVISFYQSFGWLGFKESKDIIVPDVDPIKEGKSDSQRLYNVLYVYWKQQGQKGKFSDYYHRYMETQIDAIKEKLEP